ncbi:MAG: DHA2 family efflux MFS transporter permease subunit [Hyphomonadaceae bacterium]|nr:DHA2 family efflux MFS transporter permease subunit [Hyphomonadaceae bacterium]
MAEAAPTPAIQRVPLTIAIMLAASMFTIDSTIANVALPHMQGGLSAGLDQITWVLTSFIVAQALMTPLVGWLAQRMGRRLLMLTSVVVFTAASLACGVAQNLEQMVLFRVLQGVGGASFIPLSQAILFDINPREKHTQAMAVFGAGIMLGPVIGPALGGWITDTLNWRWVFLINLPVGILAFVGIFLFLPKAPTGNPPRFDFVGFGALTLFIASLQLMLDRGAGEDWFQSWEIRIEAALALAGLYIFVFHTLTAKRPFFDRRLLGDANFLMGCLVSFVLGMLMYSSLALLPPLMQNLMGYPVVTVGLVTMPRGLGMMASMMLIGPLMRIMDARILLALGFVLNAVAAWQMTHFNLDMDSNLIIMSSVIQGVGLGMVFIPSNTLAFATVAPELRTDGAAINTLVRTMGSAIGISVMQAVFVMNMQTSYSDLIQNVRPDNPTIQALGQGGPIRVEDLSAWVPEVGRQAAMVSYVSDFHLVMLLTLAALPLVFFMRQQSAQAPAGAPHVMD